MLEIEGAIRKGVAEVTPHAMLHREVFLPRAGYRSYAESWSV
jgi:hypothetical protein